VEASRCWLTPAAAARSWASHHRDLERREHSKVPPIPGVKLLGPEAAVPRAGGGSWVDAGCWADGGWGGGGGGRISAASSVHFARKLPLLRK
jgi:hypothetical protein